MREHGWKGPALNPTVIIVGLLATLAGCVTSSQRIDEREAYWRQELARDVPIGTPKSEVLSLLAKHSLPVSEGTYRTAHPDGSETSNCRLPERALSAFERGAVRGLYFSWDIEITVCLDENDTVEGHFVGAWNAGI